MPKGVVTTNAVAPGVPVPEHPPGFVEFPKMLYYKGDATNYKIVNSAEEEDALGPDWIDRPIDPLAA